MNSINLIGRLTKDPELKQTNSGLAVTSFSLAVDRPHVKDTTDFINIVAWRKTAEFCCKYLRKGQKVGVTGVLTSRKYQAQDGTERTIFEVVADGVYFCEKASGSGAEVEVAGTFGEVVDDNDLPF
jgi:single-strand DNA-binding protein